MLVQDDESFDVINQLGIQNLVAVRAPQLDNAAANPSDGTTVAPELELETTVTESSSEVEVYISATSDAGSWIREVELAEVLVCCS